LSLATLTESWKGALVKWRRKNEYFYVQIGDHTHSLQKLSWIPLYDGVSISRIWICKISKILAESEKARFQKYSNPHLLKSGIFCATYLKFILLVFKLLAVSHSWWNVAILWKWDTANIQTCNVSKRRVLFWFIILKWRKKRHLFDNQTHRFDTLYVWLWLLCPRCHISQRFVKTGYSCL